MRTIIIASLLFTAPLSAAVFYPMDTTLTLSCRFSFHQHNRILIESGRIKKIIFPEDKLHVRMEETSGQVFVQAKGCLQEKTVISIVSQTGVVQDLEIEFADQPSEVVVLHETGPLNLLHEESLPCQTNDLSSAIAAILQGHIPSGFFSVPFTHASKKVKPGIKAKRIGRLQGFQEDLFIYQIQNTRIWKKRLIERDLSSSDTLWVYLQRSCLEPKETVLAVVAVQR